MSDLRNDDNIQFARLLSEIAGMGLDDSQMSYLSEVMDLPQERINELFRRADRRWEEIVREHKR